MNIKLASRWTFGFLIVIGLLFVSQGITLATNPIGGDAHSFDGAVDVGATANDVRALSSGDLDNDGYFDLVYGAGTALAVIENDGAPLDGWPAADSAGTAQNTIADIALADFDHDGWTDIVSVTEGPGSNEVKLWQNPTVPFTNSWTVSSTLTNSLNISITSVAVTDLDVDSFPDVVIGGSDGNIRLWANPLTMTSPFTSNWGSPFGAISAGECINDLAVADVDRDGRLDIVAVVSNTVRMWCNPGTPFTTSWAVSNTLGTLSNDVLSVVLDDLDNDGWIDVTVGDTVGNVLLWRNPLTSTAPFTTSWGSEMDIGDAVGAVNDLFAGDLDNDGDVDLISGSGSSVQAWQNDGTPFSGTWALTTPGTSTDMVYAVTASDMDHDGDLDVASGSGSNEDYEIILWPNTLVHRDIPFEETGCVVGTLASRFRAIVSVDLDGDGDLDLITGGDSNTDYELVAWENNGTPFETGWNQHNIGDLSTVYGIAAGDLDGDGDLDIVSGQHSSPRLEAWENDGTPFEGSWSGHGIGSPSARVSDVALGDLDNDGDQDIVAAIGYPVGKVIAWENDDDPFAGTWDSSDVCTITYSVNAVAIGDLDNDGWLDIVVGNSHAPAMGTAEDPVDSSLWPDIYELRAYRNDGDPFTGAWPQTNVGRDPETVTFATGHYHGYWGATVFSVALADLDNDGDLDIISTDHLEADYQIKVWENDGTPFDGLPQEQHWTWQPTAVWVEAPWMSSSVYDVATGDINNDGYVDLITASGEFYETVVWGNDGCPFGSVITDTSWIRHNLGQYTEKALSVAVGDFDQDGDLDVTHGSGSYWSSGGDQDVVAWLNQSGSVGEGVESTASDQILQGTADDLLSVSVDHAGIPADHDIELAEWRLLLEESTGDPLTSAEANVIIEDLYVYLDDGDASWQPTDTPVLTITNLLLTNGVQNLTFADDDPLVQVGPDDEEIRLFVVVQATSDASSQTPNTLIATFDPDADSIVEDRTTDTSVSIQDTVPVSTGLITFVGSPTQVIIEDLPTRSGSEVFTAALGTGASLTVYANSHDGAGNFRENVAAAWSLIDVAGSVTDTDLVPAGDNRGATFAADRIGAARILADHAVLTDDATGLITVTLGITASPNPAIIGDTSGAIVTATLVNEDLTSVTDGTVVTFTTGLGSFAGQTTVARTTAGGVATATLTSDVAERATVTVTGDTCQGWIGVCFVPGAPYTVTLTADPTSIVADGVSTSVISATVVDQYANLVTDGTVVTFTADLGSFPTMPYTRTTTDGVAVAALTAGTDLGTATVTVTTADAISSTVIQFVPGGPFLPGEPFTVTVEADPDSIVADGVSTSTITAAVTDQWSHPVADGAVVTFTTSLGGFPTTPYTRTTVGGVAVAVLTASTQADIAVVAATSGVASGTAEVTLTPGAPATLVLTAAPLQGLVGHNISITATVSDRYNNAVADGALVTVTTSLDLGGGGFLPAVGSTMDGVVTSVLTSTRTGSGVVTATAAGGASDTVVITFTPGVLASFGLSGYPASVTAGDSFTGSVVVTAYDAYGNVKTDYVGPAYFTSTDLRAALPFTAGNIYSFTIGDVGQHSFSGSGFVLRTAGTWRITVTNGTVAQASSGITVTPAALASFQVAAPLQATTGVPFSVTVTAYDTEDNLKADYAGMVTFNSTDVLAVLPTDDGTGWADGVSPFTLTLTALGSQVLTVTDGTVVQQTTVTVGTGTAATISLEDASDGTGNVVGDRTLAAGDSLTICAVARDGVGNFVENVAVSWSLVEKGGGVLDDDLMPAGDGKSASFTGLGVGMARVQVVHASLPMTTTGVLTVVPGALDHFELQVPLSGVADQPFTTTITARDRFGNTVTGFSDDVSLSTPNGGAITPTFVLGVAFQDGVWMGQVTLTEAGNDREVRAEAGSASGLATIDLSPAEEYLHRVFLPLTLCGHQ